MMQCHGSSSIAPGPQTSSRSKVIRMEGMWRGFLMTLMGGGSGSGGNMIERELWHGIARRTGSSSSRR